MSLRSLFSCGFRPFFIASSLYAFILLAVWAGFWGGVSVLPATLGGPVVWHVHELIFGFGVAAVIGFLTTAVPEFTGQKELQGFRLGGLLLLWCVARLCFWMSGVWGAWPSAILSFLLLLAFLLYLFPAVWRDHGRRHLSFAYVVVILCLLECGFHYSLIVGENSLAWLNASLGVFAALIIVALSRISMRTINGDEEGIELHKEPVEYIARPPRRNMAIFCISLYSTLEFYSPTNPVNGWVAFAASAAMLNLLNDWHIGRAFFNRWIISMYCVYCAMALSYGLVGFAILFDVALLSAAKHVLAIGGISLAVLLVQIFAGQVHCGRSLTFHSWMAVAMSSLFASVVFRLLLAVYPVYYVTLLLCAAVFWLVSFGLYLYFFTRVLVSSAADGRRGCLGVDDMSHRNN